MTAILILKSLSTSWDPNPVHTDRMLLLYRQRQKCDNVFVLGGVLLGQDPRRRVGRQAAQQVWNPGARLVPESSVDWQLAEMITNRYYYAGSATSQVALPRNGQFMECSTTLPIFTSMRQLFGYFLCFVF